MTQVPGIRPLDESDLANQLWFDPWHCFIFSAVSDSPHRDALFSGRFLKGHWAVCWVLRAGNSSSRIRGTKPFFTLAAKVSRFFS